MKFGENVTLEITGADDNPWIGTLPVISFATILRRQLDHIPTITFWFPAGMYGSLAYLLVMRVGLCAINVLGVVVSFDSIVRHLQNGLSRRAVPARSARITVRLMFIGSVVELASCAIRLVHSAFGLAISTPRFYYSTHWLLASSHVTLGVMKSLLSILLFLRWGAFGMKDTFFKRHITSIASVTAFIIFFLAFAAAVCQVRRCLCFIFQS